MIDLNAKIANLKSQIAGGLIVSCQAAQNSPLAKAEIIAAFAQTAENNGAAAVRIDSPENIKAVKSAVNIPVFGIYKVVTEDSEVYITPTFETAGQIAAAGADIIALDATLRRRPNLESLPEIVAAIHTKLNLPVMADVATLEEGLYAAEINCDFISTTLSGYTEETKHISEPDFELVKQLAARLNIPIICEGRLRSPQDVARAFECGAYATVVGNAITGIDNLVKQFAEAAQGSFLAGAKKLNQSLTLKS
jgi:N-acylglucosamine-6-phosphate 2-epimerase